MSQFVKNATYLYAESFDFFSDTKLEGSRSEIKDFIPSVLGLGNQPNEGCLLVRPLVGQTKSQQKLYLVGKKFDWSGSWSHDAHTSNITKSKSFTDVMILHENKCKQQDAANDLHLACFEAFDQHPHHVTLTECLVTLWA